MTVKAYGDNVSHFQGHSSDIKPVAEEGATFDCLDTGERYVVHDGMWVLFEKRNLA